MSRVAAAAFIAHCRQYPHCLEGLPPFSEYAALAQRALLLGFCFSENELAGAYAADWALRDMQVLREPSERDSIG